jgi:hypothetical protein
MVLLAQAPLPQPVADAGSITGPTSAASTAPAGTSVFYDVILLGGERTVITVIGNGRTILLLTVYDGDGHAIMGVGVWDKKIATIDVYRTGTFRIEVKNMGNVDNTFFISTN